MVRRRDVLSTIATGGILGTTLALSSKAATASAPRQTRQEYDGDPERRDDDRVQLIDADPASGFNVPYWLATPEQFRSEPVPIMVEMNNDAEGGQTVEDLTDPVWDQITRFELLGPWLSEELGVPHLIPVVPRPTGGPVYATDVTTILDREAMHLEGTDLDRLDRQLLRMAEHAREHVLTDHEIREKVVFYGNSSGGVVGERMAAMHPESVHAVAAGGLNGFVLLPHEELGEHTLDYPVGVNDFESILGKRYDQSAHGDVDMFYFQGGDDPKNRLSMDDGGDPDLWNDIDLLRTARAVYGADVVEERFPRCHAAFENAGLDAQFRVYDDMEHDPTPASTDIREFLRRSIEGEDVSDFGQRLELDLAREPEALRNDVTDDGVEVEFTVAGSYPPPNSLVSYTWAFGDGSTAEGLPVTTAFDDPGTYDVTVTMETVHGQRSEQTIQYTAQASILEIEASEIPSDSVAVDESVTLSLTAKNAGNSAGQISIAFGIDGETIDRNTVYLDVGETERVSFEHSFESAGDYELTANDELLGVVTVGSGETSTRTESETTTTSDANSPGFGVATALAGVGGLFSYWTYRDSIQDE